MSERNSSNSSGILFFIGCATFGATIGYMATPDYALSDPCPESKSDVGVMTITADYTVGNAGLSPRTPTDMLAVHRFVDYVPDYELIDYGDPVPPYVTLFLRWSQISIPRLLFDPKADYVYYYESPQVVYIRADVFARHLAETSVIRTQTEELPTIPLPQQQFDYHNDVAILNRTATQLLAQMKRTDKDFSRTAFDTQRHNRGNQRLDQRTEFRPLGRNSLNGRGY